MMVTSFAKTTPLPLHRGKTQHMAGGKKTKSKTHNWPFGTPKRYASSSDGAVGSMVNSSVIAGSNTTG